MLPSDGTNQLGPGGKAQFATTRWSMVLAAGGLVSPDSRQALAVLCETYWYPLYAYTRRQGYRTEEAQDLIQAFFTRLLEKNDLQVADRQRGKFRSFLLAALNHFLANEWDRTRAAKRGGDRAFWSIDSTLAESRYGGELTHQRSPEALFERRWALTVLDLVFASLRREFAAAGKEEEFDCLKEHLTPGESSVPYQAVAARLGMSEGAVKVAVHRLRRRFAQLLRTEIAQTVTGPEEIDEEIRDLFDALRS
jgi:DNA-directed RNA polymerase specialized sigma24 family protein